MASSSYKLPEDFLEKISKLNEKFDEIAPRVLNEGAEPVIKRAKENLDKQIGKGTKTLSESEGDLMESMGLSKAYQNQKGDWTIRLGASSSKDRKGVSNALKAAIIEYGKVGQPPKPWLKKTKSSARRACKEAMKNALEKEISNL